MNVFTFGETMVSFSTENNQSIIQHDEVFASVAGAESNVSIALARLGNKVKWFSRVGQDPFGRKILYELNAHGIDTSDVIIDTEHSTGMMFKQKKELLDTEVTYYREKSAASRMSVEDICVDWVKEAKLIHITGITPSLSKSCSELVFKVIDLAKEYGALISFDPNIRLKLWGIDQAREVLIPIAKQCDIFLPGKNEMKLLSKLEKRQDIERCLSDWGIPLTIMKDGENGAWIFENGTSVFVPSFEVKHVVDEIGAGDAFAAGFLHGYLQKESHEDSVRMGHACAAFVVSSKGDTDGLPTKQELNRFLEGAHGTIR